MSYLVLARKYRPQTFEQVVEQGHVTRSLSNAIAANRVAHAILFSGPRGTGKTTVARVLAKALNCHGGPTAMPCNECRSCTEITSGHAVDVYEIDGASNNSVDQVRELRENIKYMPSHSRYKIYIIDEVHMLSTPAFNALLKTLEEPPPHGMFIFATTEPHKIPITILSRCQRYDFKRISLASLSNHLRFICDQEGAEIAALSLETIAREAGGSLRDAISLLDQVMSCSGGTITYEQLLDILNVIDRKYIFDLSGFLLRNDIIAALNVLDDIYTHGHDLKKFYNDLLDHFRNLLVVKMGGKISKLVDLPKHEVELLSDQSNQITLAALNQIFDLLFREEAAIRLATQPKLAFEMALIRVIEFQPALPIDDLIDKLERLRQELVGAYPEDGGGAPRKEDKKTQARSPSRTAPDGQKPAVPSRQRATQTETESKASTDDTESNLSKRWDIIYERIAQKNPLLAANLTTCNLKIISENCLEIEVLGNEFTINMLQREKNMAFLKRVCSAHFNRDIQIIIKTRLDSNEENQKKKKRK